jgi:hypothetical protein
MATKTLDPATCTTASEAFKHPLPQVRQFHRRLTAELDGKNARLRTLVGGSYRQLLGTAEMILQMKENIGVTEDKLARVGKGCGRTVINGMAGGLGQLQGSLNEGRGAEEMGWLAKMKVLEMCTVVVGRLLRKRSLKSEEGKSGRGKNLVAAAKVWVLSRLLAKSLNESPNSTKEQTALIEESRKKLRSLNTKLLRVIEKAFVKTGGTDGKEDLVQALCAYSLATNSGTKDVIRRFLDIRADAMTQAFKNDPESSRETPNVLMALQMYTRTLLDVQALVPRRLPEALLSLKTNPLLKDQSVRESEELRLDVSERWFGDEILFFTPYIRHDDLDGSLAVETLRDWSNKSSKILLEGFAHTLQLTVDFKTVVDLRTKIFELWIMEGGKAKGFDPSVILDGFRDVINARMIELLESRVSKLHLVGTEIEATLGAWREGVTDQHATLWDQDILGTEIVNGAILFKQGVLARTHGRSDAVSRTFKGYETWRHLVDEMITMLAQLKKRRWDDDLEDIEDDLSIESRSDLLSKEDPQMLQDRLDASLGKSYSDLHEKITIILGKYHDSEHVGQISLYVLRVLRDIRSEIPDIASLRGFGLSLIPSLHETLAFNVSKSSVEQLAKTLYKKKVIGRALWEGDPALPVQPSPRVFRFLHSLTMAMANVGGDVWSPMAVLVLKEYLLVQLGSNWSNALNVLNAEESAPTNGEAVANGNTSREEVKPGMAVTEDKEDPQKEPEGRIAEHRDEDKVEEEAIEPDLVETRGEDVKAIKESVKEAAKVISPDARKEVMIQSLFDILVLHNSLQTGKEEYDELQIVGNSVDSLIELEASSRKRLERGAKEYWKRTGLLFGLLA